MMRTLQAFLALLLMTGAAWAQCADTSGTPDIKITPGTGTGCVIGTLSPVVDQSTKGGPIPATAAGYEVKLGNFSYTIAQAGSSGFPSGSVLVSNVSKTSGGATIAATGSVFEGAGGGSTITLLPGDWASITVDASNYLTLIGRYVSVISPDGTQSQSPNGPSLSTADGVWSWGPNPYPILLNGVNVSNGGSLMEVAHGGKLYAFSSFSGWYVWTAGTFAPSIAP